MARPISQKPTENVVFVVGAVVEIATVLGVKLPPNAAADAIKFAPIAMAVLPHIVTFVVDWRKGKPSFPQVKVPRIGS